MKPILFAMPGNVSFAAQLRDALDCEAGALSIHQFPDGESCPRLHANLEGRDVILVCTLDHPDSKTLPLVLVAGVARELGARSVGLVAPYLAYMRQDKAFAPGEGITSRHYARLISSCCDWMVTVDPHLHRHKTLSDIYSVPTRAVHAAPMIASWIAANVANPVLVGPDSESEQWVAEVASLADCPHTVLEKKRSGDQAVDVSAPNVSDWAGKTPVLVDDIASTARTMIAAAGQARIVTGRPAVCIAVHALFAGDAYAALQQSGVARIVSCNTVTHASNAIDLSAAIAAAVSDLLA